MSINYRVFIKIQKNYSENLNKLTKTALTHRGFQTGLIRKFMNFLSDCLNLFPWK